MRPGFCVKIDSLRAVNGLAFGAPEKELEAWGIPLRVKEKARDNSPDRNETEFAFETIRARFRGNKFVEASFLIPDVLEIDGRPVSRRQLRGFLRDRDPDYHEFVGFGIAPNLGLAYDLEHGDNLTAFVKGHWDSAR